MLATLTHPAFWAGVLAGALLVGVLAALLCALARDDDPALERARTEAQIARANAARRAAAAANCHKRRRRYRDADGKLAWHDIPGPSPAPPNRDVRARTPQP